MKVGSQALVAVSLLALGIGAFVVAGLGSEQQVLRVADLASGARPQGERVLLGVPQPALLPMVTASGVALVPNADHPNETVSVATWQEGGAARHSLLRLRAEQQGTLVRFTLTNETRAPGQPAILAAANASFVLEGLAVPVRGFDDGSGSWPLVWAVVPASDIKDPMRDVPSQFTGRIATHDDAGDPLPADALVFQASAYKAGCSSKFLPDTERARQEARDE